MDVKKVLSLNEAEIEKLVEVGKFLKELVTKKQAKEFDAYDDKLQNLLEALEKITAEALMTK